MKKKYIICSFDFAQTGWHGTTKVIIPHGTIYDTLEEAEKFLSEFDNDHFIMEVYR
jgi:hypothetical protein